MKADDAAGPAGPLEELRSSLERSHVARGSASELDNDRFAALQALVDLAAVDIEGTLREAGRLGVSILDRRFPRQTGKERRAGFSKRIHQLSNGPQRLLPERVAGYLLIVATLADVPAGGLSLHDVLIVIRGLAEVLRWTREAEAAAGSRPRALDAAAQESLDRFERELEESLGLKAGDPVWEHQAELLRLVARLGHIDVAPALHMARQFVERLLGEAFPDAVGPRCHLGELLGQLREERRLLRYADAVRVLGNIASHPWHPEHARIGPRDVEIVIRLAKELVRWLSGRASGQRALIETTGLGGDGPVSLSGRPTVGEESGAPTDDAPPRLARFEIIRQLGKGGMGVVYLVRGRLLGTVALKVLRAGAEAKAVERFAREAQALARIEHPNVVRVHEVGQAPTGQHFLVMACVQGTSLQAILRGGPLSPERAVEVVRDAALGVGAAHAQGILHRDVKPGNLLVEADTGRALVVDFGLARLANVGESLTHTGQLLGTPAYMPPEQVRGDKAAIGPAADVYSLGATLYAALTGRLPFDDFEGLVWSAILYQEPKPPSAHVPGVGRPLDELVLRCLAKSPGQRFADATELAEELDSWLAATHSVERSRRNWASWLKPLVLLGKLAILASITGLVVLAGVFGVEASAVWLSRSESSASASAGREDPGPEVAGRDGVPRGGGAGEASPEGLSPARPAQPIPPHELDRLSEDAAVELISHASDLVHERERYEDAIELLEGFPAWLQPGAGYAAVSARLAEYRTYLAYRDELSRTLAAGAQSQQLHAMIKKVEGGKVIESLMQLPCTPRFQTAARRLLGDAAYDGIALEAARIEDVDELGPQ